MTTAGKPAKGKKSLIYASGFHDVQGLAWDQAKHLLVVDSTKTGNNLDVVTAGGD